MVLLRGVSSERTRAMKKQTPNESLGGSRWQKLNILFLHYKTLRDDASRDALKIAAYEVYSYDYLCWRLSSWPTSWVDEVQLGMQKKIDDAITDPSIITKKFSGYLWGWFRSFQSSVKEKRSREDIGLPTAPDEGDEVSEKEGYIFGATNGVNEIRDSDRRTPVSAIERREKEKFQHMLWESGLKTNEIFKLYMMGLMTRDQGYVKEEFKYKGIAKKLGLKQNTVASVIRRTKLALKMSFQSLAHTWGII